MQIYQIMGQYESNHFGTQFNSHVWTDYVVYSDRLAADMMADLLNHMNDECDHTVFDLNMHDDDITSFYVEEFTA